MGRTSIVGGSAILGRSYRRLGSGECSSARLGPEMISGTRPVCISLLTCNTTMYVYTSLLNEIDNSARKLRLKLRVYRQRRCAWKYSSLSCLLLSVLATAHSNDEAIRPHCFFDTKTGEDQTSVPELLLRGTRARQL